MSSRRKPMGDDGMSKEPVIPDFEWYCEISQRRNLPPRCRFATVERCPRYYQSLSLLGGAGSTKIDPEEDERLKRYWEGSDLWPRTGEYATAVSGWEEEARHFSNFCPEVAYDRFGYFASYLGRFADEIDRDCRHQMLGDAAVLADDWRWQWASVRPMHYSECPLYSPLVSRPEEKGPEFTLGLPGASVRFRFSWRDLKGWLSHKWAQLRDLARLH